jgi:hypothetical protein
LATGANSIQFDFLLWGNHTGDLKNELNFDDPPEFRFERGTLNDYLKHKLINRCLADAVIYTGPNGDPIREDARAAICLLWSGVYKARRCEGAKADSAPSVFIATSLGAKVMTDAIFSLAEEEKGRSESAFLSQLQHVFLISNQLPLLELATSRPANAAGAAPSTLGRLLNDHAALVERTVEVTAFSDPNDLLSYRLTPENVGLKGRSARLINVIVSNKPTYFGAVANPLLHTAYDDNAAVYPLVFYGSDLK